MESVQREGRPLESGSQCLALTLMSPLLLCSYRPTSSQCKSARSFFLLSMSWACQDTPVKINEGHSKENTQRLFIQSFL